MFSPIPLSVFEAASGKVLAAQLEETTGISAKTWRKGGPTSPAVVGKAEAALHESFVRSHHNAGCSRAETVRAYESIDWAAQGLWQGLIRLGTGVRQQFQCPVTLEIAKQIDILGAQLIDLKRKQDLTGFRSVLIASDFFSSGSAWPAMTTELTAARDQALKSSSWTDTEELTKCVAVVAIYQLLSCWDVEFLSTYMTNQPTGRGMRPRPLFELVMPAMKPGFKKNSDGTYPFRGLFRLPLARLLDFSYCLSEFHRTEKWPQKHQITRQQVSSAGGEMLLGNTLTEQPLAKIRNGIRSLTIDEFCTVFQTMCGPDKQGLLTFSPIPLYLAAQLWTTMYVRKNPDRKRSGINGITYGFELDYRYYWEHFLNEFKAKGTLFGEMTWPTYLNES